MQKKHVSPEFVVIKQDEANAKFFVASFDSTDTPLGVSPKTTSSVAATYDGEGEEEVDNLW